jgi:hypothetical protein
MLVSIVDFDWYIVGTKLLLLHGWDIIATVDYAAKLMSLQSCSSGDEYHSHRNMYCCPDTVQCCIAMLRETFVFVTTKVVFSDNWIWVPSC